MFAVRRSGAVTRVDQSRFFVGIAWIAQVPEHAKAR
jgi:hypothetical protein